MAKPLIRIIPHEESIEVRVSRFYYFGDNEGCRAATKRMTRQEAEKAAKALVRRPKERAGQQIDACQSPFFEPEALLDRITEG
jgi:hypothetical protein